MTTSNLKRLALVSLLSILILAALPSLAADLSSVAFQSSPRGHILVPVSVDGAEPLVFALDTAAGRSSITTAAAEKLGLAEVAGETVKTQGVHGVSENPLVRVGSLAIAGREVRDFEMVVFDLDHITRSAWSVDGLLGMDFLQSFDVRFDFPAGAVALFPRAESGDACAACPSGRPGLPFNVVGPGFVALSLTVDGHPYKAVLDTGSGHSGVNGKTAEAMGVELPPMPKGSSGHGIGLQTGPLLIGNTVLNPSPTLMVSDHPIIEALGMSNEPAGLLGTDQLQGHVVTVSYGLGRIFVE